MKTEITTIGRVDAIILGERSRKVFLFVHGQGVNKREAIPFAEIAVLTTLPRKRNEIEIICKKHCQKRGCLEKSPYLCSTK